MGLFSGNFPDGKFLRTGARCLRLLVHFIHSKLSLRCALQVLATVPQTLAPSHILNNILLDVVCLCSGWDLNPYAVASHGPQPCVYTNSTT
jgi:hypothetical protein